MFIDTPNLWSLHMHQFLVNRVEAVSHLLLDGFAVGIQLVLHLIKTFGDLARSAEARFDRRFVKGTIAKTRGLASFPPTPLMKATRDLSSTGEINPIPENGRLAGFPGCVLEIGEALLHLLLDRPLAVGHCILSDSTP